MHKPKFDKELSRVQSRTCSDLGIPSTYAIHCAYRRNGHIIKRSRKELYQMFLGKAASRRAGAIQNLRNKQSLRGNIEEAYRYLNIAYRLRTGSDPQPRFRLAEETQFYGIKFPANTPLVRLKGQERSNFLDYLGGGYRERVRNGLGDCFRIGDQLSYIRRESYLVR